MGEAVVPSSRSFCSLLLSTVSIVVFTSSAARAGVTVSPARAAIVITTQTQQFTSSATGVTWSVDNIVGGNSTVGTISTAGLYTPPARAGTHTVTATSGGTSGSATIYLTDLKGVLTYHNDNARDGINTRELALSSSTVTTATFGKLFSCVVDGAVYAQPLWMKGVSIAGGIHNIIVVATQHDSVYVFDADANPCVTYWHINLLDTLHGGTAGEAPVTWNDVGYCYGDIYPEIGVTGTPVIDSTTNTIYVANSQSNNLTVIDGATNSVMATIAVGTAPSGLGVDSQTNFIYVANAGNSQAGDPGHITVINGATNDTYPLTDQNAKTPVAVAVNSVTNKIYVANSRSNNVTVIDGAH